MSNFLTWVGYAWRFTLQDVIDTALTEWRARFPGADLAVLELSGRLALAQRIMSSRSAEVLADHDLELWEWDVLAALWRSSDQELTMGEIGAQTFITAGSVTHRVGRLERRGLVERRQDQASRRRVLVRLTLRGEETAEVIAPSVAQAALGDAKHLTRLDLTRLNQDLTILTQLMAGRASGGDR